MSNPGFRSDADGDGSDDVTTLTVIVPLDGSEFAEAALRPASAIAARFEDARVQLVTCNPADDVEARAYLDTCRNRVTGGVRVDVEVVSAATAAEGIVAVSSAVAGSFLCMATHGSGRAWSAVLGSVAQRVVHQMTRPMVLVGPGCSVEHLEEGAGDMILCSDGSAASEAVVGPAFLLAEQLELDVWFVEAVGVDETATLSGQEPRVRETAEAVARLEQLARRHRRPGVSTNFEVLHGAPARAVSEFAQQLPSAMVAVSTHGRTGLARVALGSVASGVVKHAPCPVLVVRPSSVD